MDTWQTIDRLSRAEATLRLRAACGASRWVDRMLDLRPFGSREALLSTARNVWFDLTEDDWREAFAHHPQIGDRESLARRFPETHHLSEHEQSGIGGAPEDVLAALSESNQQYLDRFGYIFIVCAAGLSATEMLARLRARLHNDPATEIRLAADEHAKIMERRLG
jgi:2-oxo-4-hydroxy-4-carboxy-5-ureidoimidazoline decarboxylase